MTDYIYVYFLKSMLIIEHFVGQLNTNFVPYDQSVNEWKGYFYISSAVLLFEFYLDQRREDSFVSSHEGLLICSLFDESIATITEKNQGY